MRECVLPFVRVLVLVSTRKSIVASVQQNFNISRVRLQGTLYERLSSFFLGGGHRLVDSSVVHEPTDRYRLFTVASG